MQYDWIRRSQNIEEMLLAEIERRSVNKSAEEAQKIALAVLDEMTPPGWRYQWVQGSGVSEPRFWIVAAAFS